MQRYVIPALCLVGWVSGCAKPRPMTDLMTRPSPPFELGQLSRLVGTWTGTAEFVSPPPEGMKPPMPEGDAEPPPPMRGESRFEWTLDGMYLKGEGWHDMPDDQRLNYVEFVTWDAKAGKFRSWMFDDWGNHGEGWMTFGEDGVTAHTEATMVSSAGHRSRGTGTMRFVDDDTSEWTFTEKSPMGTMKLEGVMKRER